jgi:hypothetical protein
MDISDYVDNINVSCCLDGVVKAVMNLIILRYLYRTFFDYTNRIQTSVQCFMLFNTTFY